MSDNTGPDGQTIITETSVRLTETSRLVPGEVSVVNVPALELGIVLQDLFHLIQQRKQERPPNSYTTYLFNSGLDKILKKVGEEAAETIIAAKNEDSGQLSAEITDLIYHLLVLMAERELSLHDVMAELSKRAGRPADPKYGPK